MGEGRKGRGNDGEGERREMEGRRENIQCGERNIRHIRGRICDLTTGRRTPRRGGRWVNVPLRSEQKGTRAGVAPSGGSCRSPPAFPRRPTVALLWPGYVRVASGISCGGVGEQPGIRLLARAR